MCPGVAGLVRGTLMLGAMTLDARVLALARNRQGLTRTLACLAVLCAGGLPHAYAADPVWPTKAELPPVEPYGYSAPSAPTWSLVGTVAPTYTTNTFFTRNNPVPDGYWEPDMTLRVDGRFSPDLSWRLYTRSSFEQFSRERFADVSIARFGGRLTQNIAGWRLTGNYEHRIDYDGIYRSVAFDADDVMGSIAKDFTLGNAVISPIVALNYRFSDLAEARRYRFDVIVPIEVKLSEKWSVTSTPFFEGFWFVDGLNNGRRDQIYSVSLGLKYNVARNISLTASGAYEIRTSNVPLRHYTDFTIGPKLDFAF